MFKGEIYKLNKIMIILESNIFENIKIQNALSTMIKIYLRF